MDLKYLADLDKEDVRRLRTSYNKLRNLVVLMLIALGTFLIVVNLDLKDERNSIDEVKEEIAVVIDDEAVENGIHLATGMAYDENFEIVRANCTACHSAKLITQNRMSRDAWDETIQWMQETQKLWDLGPNHERILDYLEKNYAPNKVGRRQNLEIEEWYWIH